ncbi:hypothetical protein ABU178_09765 [Pantoea osteomyelitidis]|uniref:DUF4149 domain-containing protein n=1 Tax=Pantoea osteomyelitidis TaxID=3230026 RepID=A0ABW7PW41_9GAMM
METLPVLRRAALWAFIAFLLIHNDLAWSWGALITGLLGPAGYSSGWLNDLMMRLLPFIALAAGWTVWLRRQAKPLLLTSQMVMILLSLLGWFLLNLTLQYLSVRLALLRSHDSIWPGDVNALLHQTWAGYFRATAWKHALVLIACTSALLRDVRTADRTRDADGE